MTRGPKNPRLPEVTGQLIFHDERPFKSCKTFNLRELWYVIRPFRDFLAAAGIGEDSTASSICGGTEEAYMLFDHYAEEIVEAWNVRARQVEDRDTEFATFMNAKDPVAQIRSHEFKEWLMHQGGAVSLEGRALLLLHVFALKYKETFELFFDYGGDEDWYRAFVRPDGDKEYTAYYL